MEVVKKYINSDLTALSPKHFSKKPKGLSWNKTMLSENSTFVSDLKETKIKFYKILFNASFNEGILMVNYNLNGFINGIGYFIVKRVGSNWFTSDFHLFWYEKNEKRWTIE